jgi:hypothetical protein
VLVDDLRGGEHEACLRVRRDRRANDAGAARKPQIVLVQHSDVGRARAHRRLVRLACPGFHVRAVPVIDVQPIRVAAHDRSAFEIFRGITDDQLDPGASSAATLASVSSSHRAP